MSRKKSKRRWFGAEGGHKVEEHEEDDWIWCRRATITNEASDANGLAGGVAAVIGVVCG
jgi:hypothetical protein